LTEKNGLYILGGKLSTFSVGEMAGFGGVERKRVVLGNGNCVNTFSKVTGPSSSLCLGARQPPSLFGVAGWYKGEGKR
jgi:hypothetical protein